MTYADRATGYAQDVVDGRAIACRLVRLACQRHLDDLEAGVFVWDAKAANKLGAYMELMPHVKGVWADRRERLKLEEWQCFTYLVPFGWMRKDGKRRFRRVYVEVPRKNAKSTGTAALGNYMFTEDGEFGAEIYSGATTEKQAWEVFGPARLMAKSTAPLVAHYGIDVNAKNLSRLGVNAKFEPLIGKPGDGASPHFSITDEYHEHSTSEQYDTMLTGMGSREQPMAWVITTAGSDTAGPCYALRGELIDILEGTVDNPDFFGVIYTIDEGVDWTSEEALVMANPNIGVSLFADHLRSQQRDAINNPRKQSTFKTKHLNVWVTAGSPYFNLEKWRQLGDPGLTFDQFEGEQSWLGVDLAAKLDLTAVLWVFKRELEGAMHFYVFGRYYLPEEQTKPAENRHYYGWSSQGHLLATPGNLTDYDYVEADIIDSAEQVRVMQVGTDPWNAAQVTTHIMNAGLEAVEVHMTAKNLSEPMKMIQALIEDGRIHHDGNPVLSWAIGNVTAQEDRNDNVFPRKESREKKIDPAVALIIAMGRALADEGPRESKYEAGELLVL